MNAEIVVLSPEKVMLSYRLASIGSRIGAHLMDLLLAGVLVAGEALAAIYCLSNQLSVLASFLQVLFIPTIFLYFILFEYFWNGCTPGKRAMGLRVRMIDGTPITALAAIGRNLLRPADLLPNFYCVGMLCMVTTPKSQRLGDLAAGTCVFYEKRANPSFFISPPVMGFHPFEEVVGNLRGMTEAEFRTLKLLCDRFPQMPIHSQQKLLNEIWMPIANRLGVPQVPNVHPIYLAEAVVMKYGRAKNLV